MASREEEKRRRREARLAQERAAAVAARRQRILRGAGGGVLGIAAVALVVLAIVNGGDGGGKREPGGEGAAPPVAIPEPKVGNLQAAARKAGCRLRNFPEFGCEHTTESVRYRSNPPTSGPHNPVPARDGAYEPANPPAVTAAVHTLEHSRIEIQWKPGLSRRQIGQLQSLFNEEGGYHTLLFENQTGMPYTVAATAWRHLIGCPRFNSAIFDALRAFSRTYIDKGPEQVR